MVAFVYKIADGDCAILRYKGETIGLTAPLSTQTRTTTRLGNFDHKHIIGKSLRDVVISSTGKELRVHAPTLDEYIVLTPRHVTPVRNASCSLPPKAC